MKIKKILASVFALLICCGTLSVPQIKEISNLVASAEDNIYTGYCGENATYSFDETTSTLTISGTGDMYDYTSAPTPWFYWSNYSIECLIIEDGITSIGSYAFQNCKSLKEVIISNSITSIGCYAFQNCTSIETIEIPNNVTSINENTFQNCTSLREITIPNNVISIGNVAFCNCTSLEEVTIPDSVTYIGEYAFNECTSLKNIIIPNSVTFIGEYALDFTPFMENYLNDFIILGNGILYKYKGEETSITIPNNVIHINEWVFYNCQNLKEVVIPDSVISIGSHAFYACTNLEKIAIPNSVTYIGSNAFGDTPFIENYIDDFVILDNGILYEYKGEEISITIPDNVTSIGEYAFHDCIDLTEIIIPNSVSSIGNSAFWDCENLTKIIIPDSVIYMGNYVFNNYNKDFTIYGVKETQAERYATNNGFNFVAIEEENPLIKTEPTIINILNLKKYLLCISTDNTDLDFNQDGKVNILDLNVAKRQLLN